MIVKICGITNEADACQALDVGADWIGLNFVSGDRKITWDQAQPIMASIDDPARVVALVACEEGLIEESLLSRLFDIGVRRLQLYGDVLPQTLRLLDRQQIECMVVFPVGCDDDKTKVSAFMGLCQNCMPAYVLVDAAVTGQVGGTGRLADWGGLQKAKERGETVNWPSLLLAGGLTPHNVAHAIAQVKPVGVDVSSGVELHPGKKDVELMRAFVQNARECS